MKKYFFIISLFLSKFVFGQDSSNYYSIAYKYLMTSSLVKSHFAKQISSDDMKKCKRNNSVLYVCPTVNFINLSEYKKSIINNCENLGLEKSELNDWRAYKNKYYFKPYEDSNISVLNKKRKVRYCFYSSFSKMNGRVLPIIILNNEYKGVENPCSLLTSIKFGEALVILLVFDKTLSKIETALFERVSLN